MSRRWLLWRGGAYGPAQIQVVGSGGEMRTCSLRGPRRVIEGAAAASPQRTEPVLSTLAGVAEVRLVEAVSRGWDTPLHRLWEQASSECRDLEVESLVAPLLPGLKGFEVVEEDGAQHLQMVYADHELPVALAGDGARKLLRLALELGSMPEGVLLLEEPEVHQHPQALRQTAKAIVAAEARGLQIVLTTQSLELLDALLACVSDAGLERLTLYRLVLEDGVLSATGMPGGDVAVLRKAIEEDLR
jgi:hypothetical protein